MVVTGRENRKGVGMERGKGGQQWWTGRVGRGKGRQQWWWVVREW